ncbi:predicted protein [Sclerotinia sclerotiorum 1980 UF-70]|uniref:EthD domain-containing protein n=2 Tax=Sclerotinia sclerotiorum (strain ATCC 18683 / 1980 / Ss-1) TaxID=665079 RepID=A7EQ60_SCLS1|nr:predicted protein [Sclerotinia sclerotiorum 1980 UF-70]APA10142.1 hypothetical protein sscle_06g049120 [Sclerotinia sclerotiorum 1980 UF-70]EDO04976.1 predicted protein [Sclerotinia sclerotiorum 1980 UF-70]
MAPLTLSAFHWRKKGLTPEEFKNHYETVHIPILQEITGDKFPKTHTRHYVVRTSDGATSDDKSNSKYKASVYAGTNAQDFDYDVYSELVFENEAKFKAFESIMFDPVLGPKINEDSVKFIDHVKMVWINISESTTARTSK